MSNTHQSDLHISL